jgi:hypothetical protein
MNWRNIGLFAVTFALGGAAYAAVTSGSGRRSAVALVSKGIKLKDCVASSLESAKESLEDIVAEAREQNGAAVCSCCIPDEESDS